MLDPFPAALRRLREAKPLTQQALADAVGCSRQHVTRMESGLVDASLDVLVRLADALECTLDELCGRVPAS